MFRRTAGWCAYGIAVLSLLYAGVYLGLVRPDPTNATASALANGFIGLSGILATFAVIAIGDRVDGAAGRWLRVGDPRPGAVGVARARGDEDLDRGQSARR